MQPGRLLPLYSSRPDTMAQSCCFLARSFCETKVKWKNTLQNQTLLSREPFLAGNHLCGWQEADDADLWPYPDCWTFEAACPWWASSRHAAHLDTFCALPEESSTSSNVCHVLHMSATTKCVRELRPENMNKYAKICRVKQHMPVSYTHLTLPTKRIV